MPHFVLKCRDSEIAGELRPLHREAHLAHIRGSGMTRLAGRLQDAEGAVTGSLLIVEAIDAQAAEDFSRADPFRRWGVYQSVEIIPFDMSLVDFPAATGP